jgi:SWI/SNF-related matrix-associated actin-dependent regulator of chromatin subfamily A3
MLTRMRQLTLHPGLVPSNYVDQLRAADENDTAPAVQVSGKDKLHLQAVLAQAIEDSEECPICFNMLIEPRITSCSHVFCLEWLVFLIPVACQWFKYLRTCRSITEVISRDPKCPMVTFFFAKQTPFDQCV